MTNDERAHVAQTLKQMLGYVIRDCEEAGFILPAMHIRLAINELADTLPADARKNTNTQKPPASHPQA